MDKELEIFEKDCDEIITFENNYNEITTFEENTNGTNNYEFLSNQPKINDVTLIGNKISRELKLQDAMDAMTNMDIENILNNQRRSI